MQKVSADFVKEWLSQLRLYQLKHFVCDLSINNQYGISKLSPEEKGKYETAIVMLKQQSELFDHIAGSLPELQRQAIIQRYQYNDKSTDLPLVKDAFKEIHRIMKALHKSYELQVTITTDGYHLIRWLRPAIESRQLTEDDSEQEVEEDLSDPEYIEWLMQPRGR